MVQITHGRNSISIDQLCNAHWEMINPKTGAGTYHLTASLIGRIKNLKEIHNLQGNWRRASFYNVLLQDDSELLKRIITINVQETPTLIDELTSLLDHFDLYSEGQIEPSFATELLDQAFQYKNWRSNGKGLALFEMMDVDVCPYCNLNHVFVDDDNNVLVVSYDHYYDKATFPYLSLTFTNLIPSCSTCNQVYKSTFQFKIDTHLHPYLDDYNSNCKFAFPYTTLSPNADVIIDVLNDGDRRSPRYNEEFGLSARYNLDDIKRNLRAQYFSSNQYDETYKEAIRALSGLNTLQDVERFICTELNIPYQINEILKTQYGKLKRDFAIQMGVITA